MAAIDLAGSHGVNVAGGEFAHTAGTGVYGTDYHYDSQESFNYIAGRGHTLIRLPFLWERVQPTRGAPLDTTLLGHLTSAVTRASNAGLSVLLDMHNYCRRHENGVELVMGAGFPASDFADAWALLSTVFKGNPAIAGYGLMNEPHDLPAGTGTFTGTTRYSFDTGTEGWGGEGTATVAHSTTAHEGGGALSATRTDLGNTGVQTIRVNDAASNTMNPADGKTLRAWVLVPAGSPGANWKARLDVQDNSWAWVPGPDTPVTPGTWTQVSHTPDDALWGQAPNAVAVQLSVEAPTTGTATVYVDTIEQGTEAGQRTAAQVWEDAAQDAVTAIRANGDTTPVYVAGYNWSSAKNWAATHPAPWIADSANATVYEGHYYFDRDNSGDYPDTYTAENSDAQTRGYTDLTARATDELNNFTGWCSTHNTNGFIGEIGWPNTGDTTSWNATAETLYDLMDATGTGSAYWSAGERWGGTYNLSIYTGTPQATATTTASIVESHHTPQDNTGAPTMPSNVTVTPSDTSAIVSWTGDPDATSYTVEHRAVAVDATVRSTATKNHSSSTGTVTGETVSRPAGVQAGDLLVLYTTMDTGLAGDLTPPTGFTELGETIGTSGPRTNVSYKVAGASEPATYTLGRYSADSDGVSIMVAIQGWDGQTSNLAFTPSGAGNTTTTAPATTPKATRNLVLCSAANDSDTGAATWAWSPPTGMTTAASITNTGGWSSATVAHGRHDDTASTGSRAFTRTITGTVGTVTLTSTLTIASQTSEPATPPTTGYTPTSSLTSGTAATGSYTFQTAQTYTNGSYTAPYHISARAAAPGTPAPLVVHLHGDGYQEYTEMANGATTSTAYDYLDVAEQHGAIFVLPRTPDTTSETWYTQTYPTTWLVALINNIKSRYNIDTQRIFLTGYSGGAEQITYNMMADHSNLMLGGGAMILSGGGADGLAFGTQPTADLKTRFPMRWYVGENDVAGATQPATWSARDAAAGGEQFYRDAGFTTGITIIPGTAHNDAEPYGPYYLNDLINESNTSNGLTTHTAPAGTTVPPTGPTGPTYETTGGSGGELTDTINNTFVYGGKTSVYHLYANGLDWTKRVGILIYGDGSDEFGLKNPDLPYLLTGTTGLINVAKKHNLILLTPRAPGDGCTDGGGECWYRESYDGTTVDSKIAWSDAVVDHVMKRYDIDKGRVVIAGYSSGAQWTTQYFGPAHAVKYMNDGLMVAISYGGAPIYTPTYTSAFKQNVPVVWDTGDGDEAYTRTDSYGVNAGKAWYDSNGFANTRLVIEYGEDHYRYTSGVGDYGPIMDREIGNWLDPA